jgi:uncharacterized membrane protein
MVFGLRQLADIAIRALSPGVNDPTTAATCLRHVQGVLERLAATTLPDRVRVVCGSLLVVDRRSFAEALEPLAEVAAFADGQPHIGNVVLDALAGVAWAAGTNGHDDRVDEAVAMARRLYPSLVAGAATAAGRRDVEERMEEIERSAERAGHTGGA